MEDVKVSVVMPCLNSQEYIKEAIESVLNQTLKEIELIIVDAGSEDETCEIVKQYRKDSRVRLLRADKKSMGYQYNMGIENARGEYIGFVESDDLIHPEMFEKMLAWIKREQLDFIKSDFDMFIGDKEHRLLLNYQILSLKELYGKVIKPKEHPEILHRDVNIWNGLYSRRFLLEKNITFLATSGAAFQDLGFVMKSFVSGQRIMYIKMPSYYYRKDNGSASVYNRSKHIQFIMDEFPFVWNYMKERQIEAPFRAVVYKRCFGLFCAYYDFAKFHGVWDAALQSAADNFLQYLKKSYLELGYSEIRAEKLDDSLSLSLLENKKDFETARNYIDSLEREKKARFCRVIKNRLLVILGTGENAVSVYAFLKRNNRRVLCFCNHEKKKAEEQVMDTVCMPIEMLREHFQEQLSEILFLIAEEREYPMYSRQLLELGIKEENMIRSIRILPHNAYEWEMEEFTDA